MNDSAYRGYIPIISAMGQVNIVLARGVETPSIIGRV
jgi:hypothetical protein